MKNIALIVLVLLLMACSGPSGQGAASTLAPTHTPKPKTATATAKPSDTPAPTRTPKATQTVKPTSPPPLPPPTLKPTRATFQSAPAQPTSACPYIGNSDSKVFHKASCFQVKRMDADHKVCLPSKDAALAQQYRACGNCKP